MADRSRLAVAVLAAGSSRRFGSDDKLAADFRGTMLGLHVTWAIPRAAFTNAWVITTSAGSACTEGWRSAGFDVQANARSEEGMGTSVALAASLARQSKAEGLLIALADMPLVPRAHFEALIEAAHASGLREPISSNDAKVRKPPAIFGASHFETLAALGGDIGAKSLLQDGRSITCPAQWLIDIDTPQALADLQ